MVTLDQHVDRERGHLGHSSLKVTTDIYGHWERAERKLQAAKMEDAFTGTQWEAASG